MGKRWNNSERKADMHGVELTLSSGFVVFITPLPPYYKDVIKDAIPDPVFPMRMLELMSGDIVPYEYTPSEEEPDPEGEPEEFELYAKYLHAKRQEELLDELRDRARKDFLISNCVRIIDGPFDMDDGEWMERVEATYVGYEIPEEWGRVRLLFIKTQVITTAQEAEMVLELSTAPEVTSQGLNKALQGFRDQVERDATGRNFKRPKRRKFRSQREAVGD